MAKNVVTLNLDNTDYSFRPYGICNTNAAIAAKTVDIDGFTLFNGATVLIKFHYGNTVKSPTLNINNTGAKSIKFGNDTSPVFQNNDTYEFVYNGTDWDLIGIDNAIYESKLQWGNNTIQDDVSPIDAAMLSEISNNKLAFMPGNLINIEFSRDAGISWYTYPDTITDTQDSIPDEYTFISDDAKRSLVTDGLSKTLYLGARKDVQQKDDQLRITITGDGTNIYFDLKKILIYYCQANGTGNYCLVEGAYANDPETFTELNKSSIYSWPGWNSIPCIKILGEWANSSRAGRLRHLRLTFGITGVNENTTTDIYVSKLRMLGTNSWGYGALSHFASTGHLYKYDINQNTTFPANVKAATFIGSLSGTATNATNVNIDTSSSNYSFPLLFTSSVTTGNKRIYTDSENNLSYNPSTNELSTSGDIKFNAGNNDKYIMFASSDNLNNWRIGYLGSGNADANYLTFESNQSTGAFVKALQISNVNLTSTFSGDILPSADNNKSLGSSSLKWANIYATNFNGALNGSITASAPQLAAAVESNDIKIVNNDNSAIITNTPHNLASIRKAINFRWYNDNYQIGNIRGAASDSSGFGITKNNDVLCFRVDADVNNNIKAYVGSETILHTGNFTTATTSEIQALFS